MIFFVFSVIFLIIGAVLLSASNSIKESITRYDADCDSLLGKSTKCQVKIQIDADISGPVYVYYQLANYYQNHRRYVKSRDASQLRGNYRTVDQLSASCDPIVKVGDLWPSQRKNMNNPQETLSDDAPAIPCGLIAKSIFNDKFGL